MNLADMSLRLRRERVATALDIALRELIMEMDTGTLLNRVCELLGGTGERRIVARILLDLAPDCPNASRGKPFKNFGREFVRWTWGPSAAKPEPGPLVRCPHCNEREFPHNIRDGRCPACEWEV